MSKKLLTEMYRGYLVEEGFAPKIDSDGDVVFKFEGATYCIIIDEDDEECFRVIFPNFWAIDDEQERVRVHAAACAATAKTKVAKIYPIRDNVWASVEIFIPLGGFKSVFRRSLRAMQTAVGHFTNAMRLEDDG